MNQSLPYICPEHPHAQIRHEWLRTYATARLTGASWEYNEPNSDQYFCAECSRELAAKPELSHSEKE